MKILFTKSSMLFVMTMLIALSIVSCTKDADDLSTSENLIEQENPEFKEIVVGFYFTWDEWGRKKFNCRKGGLCNFRLEEITIDIEFEFGFGVPVQTGNNGDHWADIPITESMPADYHYEIFPIDEDIHYTMEDGDTFMVPAGMYPRIETIGEEGGYRLPIIPL